MNGRRKRGVALSAIAMLSVTACATHQEPTTSITVYAASALIKSFTAIGKKFEAENPRVSVEFVFAGSPELSTALADGASADVFASGDPADMTVVAGAGAVSGTPVPFATDRLVVVTPAGNPQHLTSLADLTRPGLRVSVCAAQSTCGSTTQLVEDRTGIRLHPVTSGATSNRVLQAVTGGQADAGVVYATDAQAAGGGVSWFPLPGSTDAVTAWITVVRGTQQDREAAQFVEEVTGPEGVRTLTGDGFSEPLKSPAG
jgi:molybdate transport system substrate-binding protein